MHFKQMQMASEFVPLYLYLFIYLFLLVVVVPK